METFASALEQCTANFPSNAVASDIQVCGTLRQLVEGQVGRQFSAEDLLRFTLFHTLTKNKSCNFITEVLWEEALAQSLFLDQTLRRYVFARLTHSPNQHRKARWPPTWNTGCIKG